MMPDRSSLSGRGKAVRGRRDTARDAVETAVPGVGVPSIPTAGGTACSGWLMTPTGTKVTGGTATASVAAASVAGRRWRLGRAEVVTFVCAFAIRRHR